ncbi:uncharacterized protein LOC130785508 [Actinidia eriantha]|uniref:uncharacterized protein LOC130785508 n=1 Tax=Actinidia eriantha TaxID=165200 RepID=UPI0025857DBF|nr:uncharacterized protein LOC130785508 [Actinidia eriantha]
MLGGILGRGFSSKCKSLIKPTRTRIDVLRKRKEATQRFLKENLAQLLANGLDINAYGRTEEFLAGLNLLSCYDFIEQSCECILKQLSAMQKQSECPEECREAVGSLMFAAARFSDLPELRDLRDTFQERYGSSLEHFVNHEFVEKLNLRPPTTERRIRLLQDIALECSIKWDSRGFQLRMANPSASAQDEPNKYGPTDDHNDKYKLPNAKETVTKTEKRNHSSKERNEFTGDRHRVQNGWEGNLLKRDELDHRLVGRDELTGKSHKSFTGSEQTTPKRDNHDIPFRGRREFTDDKHEVSSANGKEDSAPTRVRPGSSPSRKRPEFVNGGYVVHNDRVLSDGKPEIAAKVLGVPGRRDGKDVSSSGYSDYGQSSTANSTRKVHEEETDRLKPYSSNALPPPYTKPRDKLVPPPYVKSKDSKYGVNAESKHPSSDYDEASMDPSTHKRDNGAYRSERIQGGESDHPNYGERVIGPARVMNSHGHERDLPYRNDIPLPKPRSIRRKYSKSSSSRDDPDDSKDAGVVKRSSTSRRRDNSRKGLQILFDDEHRCKDEEERRIDKLLLHYSKKPSTYEPEKVRRNSKAPNADVAPHDSRDGRDLPADMVLPPTRSVSLPREQIASTEAVKVYTRANSFQPDKQAGHVHPKLPDYDDLAARFAALRGR